MLNSGNIESQTLNSTAYNRVPRLNSVSGKALNNKKSVVTKGLNTVKNYYASENTFLQVITIVLICILVFVLLHYLRKFVVGLYNEKINSPWLIKGTKNGKTARVITQDPNNENSITLYRSNNQSDGMEFSYTFWLCIMDFKYKYGEWKHIFHKGNKTAYPNRAPGVYLHPIDNILRFYMNTNENILEYIDIENVPIKKWIHLGMVLKQNTMDIYFNGKLKKQKTFKSVPKQNFGNVWINMYGGFEGYISNLKYYRYSLGYSEMESIVKKGPSGKTCGDTGELPPYLDNKWWYDM